MIYSEKELDDLDLILLSLNRRCITFDMFYGPCKKIIYEYSLKELIPYLNTDYEPLVYWRYSLGRD